MVRDSHWAEEHLGLQYIPVDMQPAKMTLFKGLAVSFASALVVSLICVALYIRRPVQHVQVTILARTDLATISPPTALARSSSKTDSEKQKVQKPVLTPPKKIESPAEAKPLPPRPQAEHTSMAPAAQSAPNQASAQPIAPTLPARPSNIASAEKFGIRQVASDMIVLLNGARVAINGRFPNGEVLISIDQAKGVIETDRRTMVITTP